MKNKILKITFKKAIFMCAAILMGGFFVLANNASALSIFGDLTPPSISIVSPIDGDIVKGTITLTASATDSDSSIKRVEFWQSVIPLPLGKIGEVATSPYSVSFDTTSINDGTYYIFAKAFDEFGNNSFTYITITIDNKAPVLILPENMNVDTDNPDGIAVNYSAVAVDANPKNPAITCEPVSGSTFIVGTTQVNCSATDAEGRTSEGNFNVTVNYVAPAPSVNNSGDFSTNFNTCSEVIYGDWGECVNGFQSRDVVSKSPDLCDLTAEQLAEKSKTCEDVIATSTPEITPELSDDATTTPETATSTEEQVLGSKTYADGSLLRSILTNKIYYIINGQKKIIRNLAELWQYRTIKRIDVNEEVLCQYPDYGQVLGSKTYADGSLLRSILTNKIYYIINGQKKIIRNLAELWQYRTIKRIDVNEEVLCQYPDYGQVLGVKTYPNGSLLRSLATQKIYYIVEGQKKFITSGDSWNYGNLSMTNIIEVSEDVLAQYQDLK